MGSIDIAPPTGHGPGGAEGFRPEDMAPTVSRGRNIIALTPPAPWSLAETIEGLLQRDLPTGLVAILLTADGMLAETVAEITAAAGDRARVVAGAVAERASRLLREPGPTILATTPTVALALRSRSVLPIDTVPSIVMAWPETWPDVAELAAVMADAPKDSQRILHTYDRAATEELAERYVRKPVVFGEESAPEHGRAIPPTVQIVAAPWGGRAWAIARALGVLDPAEPVLWAATPTRAAAIGRHLAELGERVALASGEDAPTGTILLADLPTAAQLRHLAASARSLVLFPSPDALPYLAGITSERHAIPLSEALERARAEASRRRARIGAVLGDGEGAVSGELHALAPLFEQHDPAAVAAALYRLWTTDRPVAPREAATAGVAEPAASAKVFVNVGRRDGATPADFVAVLTKELGVDGRRIGRVEIRDGHTLIDVPMLDAPGIVQRLSGRTIRRRKVAARLDRGSQR